MSKIAIHKQVLKEAFGKEVENLRSQKLIPLAQCSKPPGKGGPGMAAVKAAARRLGGPRFASKETLCEFLDNYAMKPIDPSLKAGAVAQPAPVPAIAPAAAAAAPSLAPKMPVAAPLAAAAVGPTPAVPVAARGDVSVCLTNTAPKTLSQRLMAEMANVKPVPVELPPSARVALDNAVAPCRVGAVERCCLKRETQCGPYVVAEIDVQKYGKNVKLLGEGTYGAVYKTDKGYAIKCMKRASKNDEVRHADLREISILRNLLHPNVIMVEQVALKNSAKECVVAAVMPLMSGTLECIDLTKDEKLRAHVMYQFVRSVAYIHNRGVLHRDIKPINVLWHEPSMTIKLADFGVAQGLVEPRRGYRAIIGTSWYRAPELFLGKTQYGAEIDVWSLGASWIDLLGWTMLKQNDFEAHLLNTFRMLGMPSAALWPEALKLPKWPQWETYAKTVQNFLPYPIKVALSKRGILATEINLVEQLLTLEPEMRITAKAAMEHPFFDTARPFVEQTISAPPIPPTTLVGCGDVLLAMEPKSVGDYLKTAYASEATRKEKEKRFTDAAKWLLAVQRLSKAPKSAVLLAHALFHRFAAKSTQEVFENDALLGHMATCFMIATKLDADGPDNVYFPPSEVARSCLNCPTEKQVVEMERRILTTLDLDIDRPTAATFLTYFLEDGNADVKERALDILLKASTSYYAFTGASGLRWSLVALTAIGATETPCMRMAQSLRSGFKKEILASQATALLQFSGSNVAAAAAAAPVAKVTATAAATTAVKKDIKEEKPGTKKKDESSSGDYETESEEEKSATKKKSESSSRESSGEYETESEEEKPGTKKKDESSSGDYETESEEEKPVIWPAKSAPRANVAAQLCEMSNALQTLSQKLAVEMAQFKPLPAHVETSPKIVIDNAVAPCRVGAVDRCCLQRETLCGPYIITNINVQKYGKNVKLLGEGTYGAVYKTDKGYAIKCMKLASKGAMIEDADLREISVLRNLVHPNIVMVEQVSLLNSAKECVIAAVMPLMNGTLQCVDLTKDRQLRSYIMYQFVRGVAYVHSRGVLHRDIKPANVLWHEPTMTVKLADFGLAQGLVEPGRNYSDNVTTAAYRAPEIFLGKTKYGSETDVWSIGASWLELVGYDMLKDDEFEEQLLGTFLMVGQPSVTLWPEALKLPNWPQWEEHAKKFGRFSTYPVAMILGDLNIPPTEIDLVEQLLTLDPNKRITANAALRHPFFDAVRSFVEQKISAPPIPPNILIGCGDVLLAMEPVPVGDYVEKFFSDDSQRAAAKQNFTSLAKWANMVITYYHLPASVGLLAQSLFHRFAARETKLAYDREQRKGNVMACLLIAKKLDADGPQGATFEMGDALYICANCVTSPQLIEMERKILTTLDLDLDRPTAATFLSYFLDGEKKYTEKKEAALKILLRASTSYDINVNVSGSLQSLGALVMVDAAESVCVRQLEQFSPKHTVEYVKRHIVPLLEKTIEK